MVSVDLDDDSSKMISWIPPTQPVPYDDDDDDDDKHDKHNDDDDDV